MPNTRNEQSHRNPPSSESRRHNRDSTERRVELVPPTPPGSPPPPVYVPYSPKPCSQSSPAAPQVAENSSQLPPLSLNPSIANLVQKNSEKNNSSSEPRLGIEPAISKNSSRRRVPIGASHLSYTRRDAEGRRGSATRNNLNYQPPNVKVNSRFNPVEGETELFHVRHKSDLPYTCPCCLVGTKLPDVYEKHLRCPKHFDTLARFNNRYQLNPHCNQDISPQCIFCNKDFHGNITNYRQHLSGKTHFKNFNKFKN